MLTTALRLGAAKHCSMYEKFVLQECTAPETRFEQRYKSGTDLASGSPQAVRMTSLTYTEYCTLGAKIQSPAPQTRNPTNTRR